MKKGILYFSVLLVYLLAACTLLSQWIEVEMATEVVIQEHTTTSDSNRGSSMTADVLFLENGVQALYEVVEGEGWQGGLRLKRMDENHWEYVLDKVPYVRFVGGKVYWFAETASRTPADGGPARIVEGFETVSDRYLLVFPEGKPEKLALPEDWQVTKETEAALLVQAEAGIAPFFQHRAKFLAGIHNDESSRIISLGEAEAFLNQLPAGMAAGLILAFPVLLWLYAAFLLGNPQKHRAVLLVNLLLGMVSLGALWLVLRGIELPGSMLPGENLFDLGHYRQEYGLILDNLELLGETGPAELAVSIRERVLTTGKAGALVCLAVLAAETVIPALVRGVRRWKAKRYRGKYLAVRK